MRWKRFAWVRSRMARAVLRVCAVCREKTSWMAVLAPAQTSATVKGMSTAFQRRSFWRRRTSPPALFLGPVGLGVVLPVRVLMVRDECFQRARTKGEGDTRLGDGAVLDLD